MQNLANKFEFSTATRILFGAGTFKDLGIHVAEIGQRALVTYGVENEFFRLLIKQLENLGIHQVAFAVTTEPTISSVKAGTQLARDEACDVVVSLGGGSAMDTGKAIAILLENPGEIEDYLEVIGKGKKFNNPGVPMVAIPTTAGTGAEVTRNAVLGVPENRIKVSLRSPWMLPRLALVDPELTYDLPPEVTASTGLDALTQLIEPFVSVAANPLTDALCREGMQRAARSLRRVFSNGRDAQAREDMSLASLFGGLALANARLGAVHGFAGVLGGRYPGPHGAICAKLLPLVMETNLQALHERLPESEYLYRYQEVARILTNSEKATLQDGLHWVKEVCLDLQIPTLSVYGLRREDIPSVVEMSARASSMKGNPILLTSQEMESILNEAL